VSDRDELTAIDSIVPGLIQALTERLAGHGLGEIEVRQGELRVRVVAPASSSSASAVAAPAAAPHGAGVGQGARFLVGALIALLVGFEAANLRRWALLRRGWRERPTVVGDDLAAAERRFFAAYVASEAARDAAPASPSPPAAPAPAPRPAAPDVIGLFPQPGASR